jgi:hypothetical protein
MPTSSWKVGQWTTPTTPVTVPPVPSEVSPESKSQISDRVFSQFPSFVREDYQTFIDFVRAYYKSQELKGNPVDVIQNWDDYYNIDKYSNLVQETVLISALSETSTTIDVQRTRDFPNEGLLLIDDEIIYYNGKGVTLFQNCARGFSGLTSIGSAAELNFEYTEAASHATGAKVINLNNLFPLFILSKFKEQYLATFPKDFNSGVEENVVIKRIKDFYASKGTSRSFQFILRTIFGVESSINYPRDRIFKPSDAYYVSREVIRARKLEGNPMELVGQVLYQQEDPTDENVKFARIYVKSVVEIYTEEGVIYEIDVDTNNSAGTFVTPYKTILADDLGGDVLTDTVITVDSTIGWPEQNGKVRIEDEIISYAEKTVNQFIGCTRARDNTSPAEHVAGHEVIAAFEVFGYSNLDGSKITIKMFGGTRGIKLNTPGKYYLPNSKITTPTSPGFDSIDSIWKSFIYNVRRAFRGTSIVLGSPNANGSVIATVTTVEDHDLNRDDKVTIVNADEDIYNATYSVVGVGSANTFNILIPATPISTPTKEFIALREFSYGTSDFGSIRNEIEDFTADIQNTYRSTDNAIVACTGIPSHKIGPFGANDILPGNQRYLKRIPLQPITKSTKQPTPVGQIGIGVNGVPFFSYKGNASKKYGGLIGIEKINGGDGYDITNPPIVEFEPDYQLDTNYAIGTRVKYNGNRYVALESGQSAFTTFPTHTSGVQVHGNIRWEYEGSSATGAVEVDGRVIEINVTNGGSGYTSEPIVAIIGGGASPTNAASAAAQITNGVVTNITITSAGSGYTSVPTISITGGGGSGATGLAVVRGSIKEVHITSPGTNYSYEPQVNLVSGSGAVAYPSILNGRIESIIVTFGGERYFGPPDVVIVGDGVGATAFANVDLTRNIVTDIVVTNKGIGYTPGKTEIFIVYPGVGAQFQTKLTELTYNEAANANELGVSANTFIPRVTFDSSNGASFQGANYLIYGGEYGYMFSPKRLRFLLEDNINSSLVELTPTKHSPILGWAYDGNPIYGPYGYKDKENKSPFNEYKQLTTSYRIKSTRTSLVDGLTDPLGTFIEDYEYVEGLGDLDEYNGRYCVTPEYPNGVYAYFCTIDGVTGNPKFPYFIGPNFYSQANEINWNGNGLQRGFTEDAIRYKAPYLAVDNLIVKRKQLIDRIEFYLALEDTTTIITTETGDFLELAEDGIGYFDYYPSIKGSQADSLYVASTNKYSSSGIDQYLLEGGGSGYKVNDRLIFDEENTGGSGLSAVISSVEGVPVSTASFAADDDDVSVVTLTTTENHYVKIGDLVNVSVDDNLYEREIGVKIIGNKYHFNYFDLQSAKLMKVWQTGVSYQVNDLVYNDVYVYKAKNNGTSGATSPTHTSGTVIDGVGGVEWEYVRVRTDGNLYQGGWSSITGGSNYLNGTYTNVPLTTSGNGVNARATIVVSGGAVTSVTITNSGYGYEVGDTISASNLNLGYNLTPSPGSGFSITLTEVQKEVVFRSNKAHQLRVGDIVNISGINPSAYDNSTYSVVRIDTNRRFVCKRNFANPTAAIVTTAEVYVREPKLQFIDGHRYKFDVSDSSHSGRRLTFSLDPDNTEVFTYKNIFAVENDQITGEQQSITIRILDLPSTFYYFDINGLTTGLYFNLINDPIVGTNTVTEVTDTTIVYELGLEPETSYNLANDVSYITNSIYPKGGVGAITIGDPGRNYSSIPALKDTFRSGAGATAVATIAGPILTVGVTNKGSGYNAASLPTAVMTMPDFVDLTLDSVLGSFVTDEIIVSQTIVGTQTARGKVISWNPSTSILRVQPLRNTTSGAANKGYIMFSTVNVQRNKVYSADSQASIVGLSGTQAQVAAIIPATGPNAGSLESVAVNNPGSNYRVPPQVILDDPYYGGVTEVSITSQNTSANFTAGTYTGVVQKSVAPTGGTGATFTVTIDAVTKDVISVVPDTSGYPYALGDVITISGAQITGGVDVTDDFTVTVTELSFSNPAQTSVLINASIDSVTVTNGGSGYLSSPDVLVSGGNGINAILNAQIVNQGVTNIVIEDGGEQFQSPPVINIVQTKGTGVSLLLKSSDLGQIVKIGGDNITFNYSHDRTLKPELNTTYNLQLIRTQVIDYLDVIDGGFSFVAKPTILLEGGSGSAFSLNPIIQNEVIQEVQVVNPGKGFLSAPTVKAQVSHAFVALRSNSTLNFAYDAKIPTGTKVSLREISGKLPQPLLPNVIYYAIEDTIANGLANNQIRLATSLANANAGTYIVFTSAPTIGNNGVSAFVLDTTDLGARIVAYMKPGEFSVGERIYQGASTASYTAYGFIKEWDPKGRVVSVEIVEGEFRIGEPVFGAESAAFGQIHAFDRADAVFEVSPISISGNRWERTTGFLDLNEQRLYDSNRFQEFSYEIASPINIKEWKNPIKFAAHPAGFKVFGSQIVSTATFKDFKPTPYRDFVTNDLYNWWLPGVPPATLRTFNGTTYFTPKPTANNVAKLSRIDNFALGKADYTATVPTEVLMFGRQLLDVQKILTNIVHKIDTINYRAIPFDGSSSSAVNPATDEITLTNHGLVQDQRVIYNAGGDRFQDARDLIVANIDYIVEETIGHIEATFPALTDGSKPDYDPSICARDTRLVIAAWANDLRYGGNAFTVKAVNSYIGQTVLVADRYGDARNLLRSNKTLIAEEAVGRMLVDPVVGVPAGFPGVPGGNQNCIDDVVDFIESMSYNLAYGGNSEVYDAANLYVTGSHVQGEEDASVKVFEIALELCEDVIQNYPIITSYTSEVQVFDNSISTDPIGFVADRNGDAYDLLQANKVFVANEAVQRYLIANPSFVIPTGNQNCIDDVIDVINAVSKNVGYGGNDHTYDAAAYYVGTSHINGEETETIAIMQIARDLCQNVINNESISVQGSHGLTQTYDYTITVDQGGCAAIKSTIATLFSIVTTAVSTDSMAHATRTGGGGYVNSCQNVVSSMTTLFGILIQAIGTNGNPGNLTGITRTVPVNNILHIGGEELETIAAYNKARDLAILAVNNNLPFTGTYTTRRPFVDLSITYDSGGCANVVSALTTLSQILTEGIDNPGTIPDIDVGFYPNVRTGDPIQGLVSNTAYYVDVVDADTIRLLDAPSGNVLDITSVGSGPAHQIILSVDGINNKFKLRKDSIDISTVIAKTAQKSQLIVSINGIIQNPKGFTVSNDILEFAESPLENSEVLAVYFDRKSYSNVFELDTFGDAIQSFNTTNGLIAGAGYTNGVYTSEPLVNKRGNGTGATANIAVVGGKVVSISIVDGGSGYTNNDIVSATLAGSPTLEFQVEVEDVTFDGVNTTFTSQVGGSNYALPASDNFLLFLNSTLQVKGTEESYTYTGSTITFNEAPLGNMDFYCFYFGKLNLLDDISPFFDNSRKTYILKQSGAPFSIESDDPSIDAAGNLLIFVNGIYQEPGVSYTLRGSLLEFDEAPRAGSNCVLYVFLGSNDDILREDTFNSIDPGDIVKVSSEADERILASISSSTTIDTYEYVGLRPTPAEFTAVVLGGRVAAVTIVNPGLNYENPPILVFTGGGGEGAFAQTTIDPGTGEVTGIINLNPGNGYTSIPKIVPTHPVSIERSQRNRIISNSNALAVTYLTNSITSTSVTINAQNVYWDLTQQIGFPDEGEILIPVYSGGRWRVERILYGSRDVNTNTFTVATNGRGNFGTGPSFGVGYDINVVTGSYTSSGTLCTVNTSGAHNYTTGMSVYLKHTSGTGFDGSYKVNVTSTTQFTVEYPFARTTSGSISILPEIRLRSL